MTAKKKNGTSCWRQSQKSSVDQAVSFSVQPTQPRKTSSFGGRDLHGPESDHTRYHFNCFQLNIPETIGYVTYIKKQWLWVRQTERAQPDLTPGVLSKDVVGNILWPRYSDHRFPNLILRELAVWIKPPWEFYNIPAEVPPIGAKHFWGWISVICSDAMCFVCCSQVKLNLNPKPMCFTHYLPCHDPISMGMFSTLHLLMCIYVERPVCFLTMTEGPGVSVDRDLRGWQKPCQELIPQSVHESTHPH